MPELDSALYIVATPIGNLQDLSPRALFILSQVDLIAAEDTRRTQKLCHSFGITTSLVSYHDGNERDRTTQLMERLRQGQSIALVSDAGTPLISDPGYRLVQAVRAADMPVFAVPGPSALTAALSVSGLPADRFVFEGFLPEKMKARRELLSILQHEKRTLVFFEVPHRLIKSLVDICEILGADRDLVIIREISKRYETGYRGSAEQLLALSATDSNMTRGELVILARGRAVPDNPNSSDDLPADLDMHKLIRILADELGPAQASKIVARLTGMNRQDLYGQILDLKK